uniref:NADH-ubiquinone oxidoreductase chain 4L n=1 Tax=Pachycephus smyrnensis TaxID=1090887 RepID=A0A1W6Q5F9_9HYME|nr:NADH dehydrogenase subunit 4L [Pachycephus smyrnensis]ARO34953.1 NADH dehydrogenase subunit 4L [Pachycephus smyrnensis]UTY22581.1 NADH dehydrogenase subunit 4L [Pachycephus smyrnensis]
MLMFIWFYLFILLIGSLMIFIKFNKHMLLILMSLEFFVILMYYVMYSYFLLIDWGFYISLYYLIFSVCESVLGLSVMVVIMRGEGSDYLQTFSMLKW